MIHSFNTTNIVIQGLAPLWFFLWFGLALTLAFISLAAEKEVWGLWWPAMMIATAFAAFRWHPSFRTLLYGALASLVVGVIYTILKWVWECRKFGINMRIFKPTIQTVETVNGPKAKPVYPCHWKPEAKSVFDDYAIHVMDTFYDSVDSYIQKVHPATQFSHLGSTVTAWTLLWPFYLFKDIAFDLVENLRIFFTGLYRRFFQTLANLTFRV